MADVIFRLNRLTLRNKRKPKFSLCLIAIAAFLSVKQMSEIQNQLNNASPTMDNLKNKLIVGDALTLMRQMPDQSIDLVVTSPPYNLKH